MTIEPGTRVMVMLCIGEDSDVVVGESVAENDPHWMTLRDVVWLQSDQRADRLTIRAQHVAYIAVGVSP